MSTPVQDWYITGNALPAVITPLAEIVANPKRLTVGHNLKYDLHFLTRKGIVPARIADSMIAAYLCDENRELGLKPLAHTMLGMADLTCSPAARSKGSSTAQVVYLDSPAPGPTWVGRPQPRLYAVVDAGGEELTVERRCVAGASRSPSPVVKKLYERPQGLGRGCKPINRRQPRTGVLAAITCVNRGEGDPPTSRAGRYYYASASQRARACAAPVPMNRPHPQRRPRFTPSHDLAHATPALQDCIARYSTAIPSLAELCKRLATTRDFDALVDLYEQCTPLLEQAMWSGEADFHPLLASYQALFREQEALIRQRCKNGQVCDDRHHFILSIPIADRPPHLRACLESIYQVCTLFGVGPVDMQVPDPGTAKRLA